MEPKEPTVSEMEGGGGKVDNIIAEKGVNEKNNNVCPKK
jgi:hypothetical protein